MPEPEWSRSNRWLTVILITPKEFGCDREVIRLALEAENIESRPVWKPMHLQPVFRAAAQSSKLKAEGEEKNTQNSRFERERADRRAQGKSIQNSKFKNINYPSRVVGGNVAEDLFARGLCLPSGTAMTEEDLDRVVKVILQCR
jgi:dTDP-4-amino-4,6-dideoxygalactose transaminase